MLSRRAVACLIALACASLLWWWGAATVERVRPRVNASSIDEPPRRPPADRSPSAPGASDASVALDEAELVALSIGELSPAARRFHQVFGADFVGPLLWQKVLVSPWSKDRTVRQTLQSLQWDEQTPLTAAQKASCLDALERLIMSVGMRDDDRYFRWAAERGANARSYTLDDVLGSFELPPAELTRHKGDDQVRLLNELFRKHYGERLWTGWSTEPGRLTARSYAARSDDDLIAANERLASRYHASGLGSTHSHPFAAPPARLRDRVLTGHATIVIDVEFWAQHGDDRQLIAPHILRMWWDDRRQMWQPDLLISPFFLHALSPPMFF